MADQPTIERVVPTPQPVRWQVWPLVRPRPAQGVAMVGVSLLVVAVVYLVTRRPELGALAWLMLALAGWRTWIPIDYELNFQGVTARVFRRESRLAWQLVGYAQLDSSGVWLWSRQNSDAPPWGFLPWGDQRQQVLAWLEYRGLLKE